MSDNQRIIEAIAPHLPGGQVQHDSKGTWEWRGTPYGCRTRVQAESELHCRVQVEVQNPFGEFQLEWSPKYVPDPTAIDNDAFDPVLGMATSTVTFCVPKTKCGTAAREVRGISRQLFRANPDERHARRHSAAF